MRHGMSNRKLGRTTSHRLAMFRNQIASLVLSERIVTTLPKAKAEGAEGGEPEASEEKKATTKRKASPKAGKSVPQQKTDAKSKARPSTQQKPKGGTRSGGGRKSGGE